MALSIVPLADAWAERAMQIVVRRLDALPTYARELVDLLVQDARDGSARDPSVPTGEAPGYL